MTQQTERQWVEAERATLVQQLQEEHAARAALEERERIAAALHDGVIQSLYAVALHLAALSRTDDTDWEQTRAALRDATAQIQDVIRQVGEHVYGVAPPEKGN